MRTYRSVTIVTATVAVSLTLAMLNAATADVADPWNRPAFGFGFAFPRLAVVWVLLGLLCLAAAFAANRLPVTRSNAPATVAIHLAFASTLTVIHMCAIAAVHSVLLDAGDPFGVRVRAMLADHAPLDVVAYSGVVILVHAFRFRSEARQRELQALALQASLADARLATLRAKLEPHFLFNALNTAVMLARNSEPDKVVQVLTGLSDLLRAVLESDVQEITLADEVALMELYLDIERERFHDRLAVGIELPPDLSRALVPQLILQPLAENAIRHGISQHAGGGRIDVSARRTGDSVTIALKDSGPRRQAERPEGHGIGLETTRSRLAAHYGDRARFSLERNGDSTTARVVLPFRERAVTPVADGVGD